MSEVKLTKRIFKPNPFWYAIGKQGTKYIICGPCPTRTECKEINAVFLALKAVKPVYIIPFPTRYIEKVRLYILINDRWIKLRKILGIKDKI